MVLGPIGDKWASLSRERGALGYPTTDTLTTPDGVGRFNHFQRGSIYWSPQTGPHVVSGPVYDKWAKLNWEKGSLGYPVTDVTTTPDGKGLFAHFQHGSIYWTQETGAHVVSGPSTDKWAKLNWEKGSLGYPVTDVTTTP